MPTKQITVCARCGRSTCDGGIWRQIRIVEDGRGEVDLTKLPPVNLISCTLGYGHKQMKLLTGKPVGTEVELRFPNWMYPATVRVLKIQE